MMQLGYWCDERTFKQLGTVQKKSVYTLMMGIIYAHSLIELREASTPLGRFGQAFVVNESCMSRNRGGRRRDPSDEHVVKSGLSLES